MTERAVLIKMAAASKKSKQKVKSSHVILMLVLLIGCAMISWLNMVSKTKESVPEFTQHLINQAQKDAQFAVDLLHSFDTTPPSNNIETPSGLISQEDIHHPSIYDNNANNNDGVPILPSSLPDLPTISQQMEFIQNAQETSFQQQIVNSNNVHIGKQDTNQHIESSNHNSDSSSNQENISPMLIGAAAVVPYQPPSSLASVTPSSLSAPPRAITGVVQTSSVISDTSLSLASLNFEESPISLESLGTRWPYFIHFHKGERKQTHMHYTPTLDFF